MDSKQHGCFAWLIRAKKSCNQRWAKFRNNLRKRFHRQRPGSRVGPLNLDNETGTMDLIITKVPYNDKSRTSPSRICPPHIEKEEDEDENDVMLTEYITEIINNAKSSLEAESRENKVTCINVEPATDNISMTSSIISQIANIAVVESLTCIMEDVNQSCTRSARPKTLSEYMGICGINLQVSEVDGMPVVTD